MVLGAAWRRFSSRTARVTGIVSTTVLLCTAAGSFGTAVAAPYPPTSPPCALSWSQQTVRTPTLIGSGYDTNQPVTVTLYPRAERLGSYATNATGAFEVPLDVPSDDASWVTATSPHRSCSVIPPSSGSSGPSSPRSTQPSPGGTTPSAGTSSTGGGSSTSGTGNTGSGTGNGTGDGTAAGGGANSTALPYPPKATSGRPGSASAPTSSTAPSRPASTAGSTPPRADSTRTAPLGLPLSVIVTIAALLLLAGGLGVLLLTRRSE